MEFLTFITVGVIELYFILVTHREESPNMR
jgi:hypothetical protein